MLERDGADTAEVVAGRVDAVAAEGLILNLGGITVVYIVNDIQHTHSILYLFAYTIRFKSTA